MSKSAAYSRDGVEGESYGPGVEVAHGPWITSNIFLVFSPDGPWERLPSFLSIFLYAKDKSLF